jgi:four helix bundle protein
MLNLNHKNLNVWKLAMDLVTKIYKMTAGFPKEEMYGIISQIRRASISVPSNIAEGASRSSGKERKRFFEISRSSLVEIDTQLEIALKLNYCSQSDLTEISEQMNHLFASLSKLISRTK